MVDWCTRIVRAAGIEPTAPPATRHRHAPVVRPTVLVLGASGFIGRELVHQLLAADYCVRAAVRSSSAALEDLDSDHLEIVHGDMRSETDLRNMMNGIEFVYHLAHASAKT